MKDGTFVFDSHSHVWDASPENTKNKWGEIWIECFYAYQTALNPPDPKWKMDYDKTFRKTDEDWYIDEMFVKGDADMALLGTTVLKEFFHEGFHSADKHARIAARYPGRMIVLGGLDPRAPDALEEFERQITKLGVQGFKWYTAEWRGDSKGWRADDPMMWPFYKKAVELGCKHMHFHKGPGVAPLALGGFDVRDIEIPAAEFPELNFIIDHCGLPRLDDFCWIAVKQSNIYAALAVALAFINNRPRYFAEIMSNLLYWVGPDRIVYGTDFPIWYPHWQLDKFMEFQIPDDLQQEYGVKMDDEARRKILGGNLAKLYGIDIEARKKALASDALSQRKNGGG